MSLRDDLRPRDLAAAFLVAASLILFQVSFSRLISYKLFYHFVFFAISLSLLGLGAAGTYVALRRPVRDLDGSLAHWLTALLVSVPIAFLLIANPFAVSHHPPIRTKLLGADAIAYLGWCAPLMVWLNFCGGVVLTSLFARYSARMGALYAADLLGAGAGSLACVAVMKYASPPAAFVGAVLPLAAALLPYRRAVRSRGGHDAVSDAAALAGLVLAVVVFAGPSWLRDFTNFRTEDGSRRTILKYEWNHLIRTDHVPGWYVLDGEAATRIANWKGKDREAFVRTPAYALAPEEPEVAIVGVGGGRELAESLRAGASRVLAIDLNPTILRWAKEDDRKLNGGLYDDPRVELRLGEGRHTIRSAGRPFDVIVMHAIDTYAAAASGAYALTENFLYTKEALQDYYHALSDDGVLSISRWLFHPPREDLRVFHTGLEALRELGVADPRRHFVMMAPMSDYRTLGDRRVWGYLLMSKRPLDAAALARLRKHAKEFTFSFLYAPDARSGTPFDRLAHAQDFETFQRGYPFLVSVVTDANPYLFQFYNPLHRTAYQGSKDWATVHIYQWSAVTLLASLVACTVLSFAAIIAPLLWASRRRSADGAAPSSGPSSRSGAPPLSMGEATYFAGLGLGFMAFEVPIIQVLSMYLGHPTFGFSVVLVALLVATGVGSLLVERLDVRPTVACAAVATALAVTAAGAFPLAHATLDLPDGARFAVAIALVAACGVPMGMPLALGVRRLGRRDARSVAWAWGINGAASVVGACVVMIALVFAGSQAAFAMGALCYGGAAAAGLAFERVADRVGAARVGHAVAATAE